MVFRRLYWYQSQTRSVQQTLFASIPACTFLGSAFIRRSHTRSALWWKARVRRVKDPLCLCKDADYFIKQIEARGDGGRTIKGSVVETRRFPFVGSETPPRCFPAAFKITAVVETASSHVSLRSDTNTNPANYATQHQSVAPVMLVATKVLPPPSCDSRGFQRCNQRAGNIEEELCPLPSNMEKLSYLGISGFSPLVTNSETTSTSCYHLPLTSALRDSNLMVLNQMQFQVAKKKTWCMNSIFQNKLE